MSRPLLATALGLTALAVQPLAAQSSTRVTATVGAMRAYGSTGPMGTLGVSAALGAPFRIGAEVAVGRMTLENTRHIHRQVVGFGPTLGVVLPLPGRLTFAVEGTVRFTHLNIDTYLFIPEFPPTDPDRISGSRNGVSWGATASVGGPVTRVLDVRGSIGYLRNSIYENRSGNIMMATLGVALRPD